MKNAVVIIPFHLSKNWPADFLTQTAKEVSHDNFVFCFLSHEHIRFREIIHLEFPYPIIKVHAKRLWFVHPVFVLPFERFDVIRKLNHQINLVLLQMFIFMSFPKAKKHVFWIFDHTQAFLLRAVSPAYTVLYDCIDYVWHTDKNIRKKYQQEERTLMKHADYMVVNSRVLFDIYRSYFSTLVLVPLGFRIRESSNLTNSLFKLPKGKPIIGYVGVIDYRFDFPLLYALAHHNPQWQFVLWGPIHTTVPHGMRAIDTWIDKLRGLTNVLFGESHIPGETASIIRQFTVCMIPYDDSLDIVKYSYPMKVFEYFYWSKPVISTNIYELAQFPDYIKLGESEHKWQKNIEAFLRKPLTAKQIREQKALAQENSWENKINKIYTIIHE